MIRKCYLLVTVLAGCSAIAATPGTVKNALVGSEPSGTAITGQQAESIVVELREIKVLLEKLVKIQGTGPVARAPAPPAKVNLKLAPESIMLGDKNAPFTMVEYLDLQCPFCKSFEDTTFTEIRKNLIDTGKLRYYSRDFPLDMHPFAMKAAVAVHCAAEQGQFWRMRDVLMTNSANLAPDAIAGYAKTAGLNTASFASCFASTKYDASIHASVREGSTIGVQGTPSFVLGKSTADGVDGTVLVGTMPYATIEADVKKLDGK